MPEPKPGCWSRNVIACPCTIASATFVIAALIAGFGQLSGNLQATANAGYDTPAIREQQEWYGWRRAYATRYKKARAGPKKTESRPRVNMLYQGLVDDNALTEDGVAGMAEMERMFLAEGVWQAHCLKAVSAFDPTKTNCSSPVTLLRYLHVNDALQEQQCRAGYCDVLLANPSGGIAWCSTAGTWGVFPCTSTTYDWRSGALAPASQWPSLLRTRLCSVVQLEIARVAMFDKGAVCDGTTLQAKHVRSQYTLFTDKHTGGRKFALANLKWAKQLRLVLDEAQSAVSATPPSAGAMSYDGKALNAWYACGLLPGLGWCDPEGERLQRLYLMPDLAMATYSGIFITLVIIVNTGSALLTLAGLFEILASLPIAMAVWTLCGQTVISTLMLLGLFIVLCIGADDIFVFIDTWKESCCRPAEVSGTVLSRFAWTYTRASSAMLATTMTTFFCLLLNAFSKFAVIRSFGIFNAFVIVADFLLVVTWFASIVVAIDKVTARRCPPGKNFECSCLCPGTLPNGGEQLPERKATAYLKRVVAPAIFRLRWPLLLLSAAVPIGGIVACSLLFQEGETNWFNAGHPIMEGMDIATTKFGSDSKNAATLLYGLKDPAASFPVSFDVFEREKDDYYDRFVPQYDDGFTFDAAAQAKIVADCEAQSHTHTHTHTRCTALPVHSVHSAPALNPRHAPCVCARVLHRRGDQAPNRGHLQWRELLHPQRAQGPRGRGLPVRDGGDPGGGAHGVCRLSGIRGHQDRPLRL